MISSVSFWHDEIVSVLYAQTTSWGDWLQRLLTDPNSEAQMPLFLAWGRLLEILRPSTVSSEWMYRFGNLPWIWISMWAFYRIGRHLRLPWLPALWILHPFVWFYANEFRPYAMQLAGGSLLLLSLTDPRREVSGTPSLPLLIAGSLLTAGSSMLGFFSLAAYALADLWISRVDNRKLKPWLGRWLTVGGVLSPLILYDLWTFLQGSGGAKLWKVGPANLAFSVYEFLGLSGLGPPRNDIRETIYRFGLSASDLIHLGSIRWLLAAAAALCFVTIIGCGAKRLKETPSFQRIAVVCGVVLVGNWIILLVASWFVSFPFWGRHLSPCFPALLLFVGVLIGTRPPRTLRIAAAGWITLLMVSAIQLRCSSAYQKDDLRSAYEAAAAILPPGAMLWWAASPVGGSYYHQAAENHIAFTALTPKDIESPPVLGANDMVVLGRASLHDPSRSLTRHLETSGFTEVLSLTGTGVWRASTQP